MAQAEATSRRADSLGDIDDWMLRRRADLKRLGSEAEAAGREAWGWATRSGQDVAAARPRDVALLGERFRRGQATPTQTTRVSLTEPEPPQKIEDAVELGEGPDFAAPQPMDLGLRFQAARSGDSISRLLGSSDPRAIGKFLSLNGMDGGAQFGGGGWSAEALGWTRYGPLDRLNYGASPSTKAVVGPILFGGAMSDLIDSELR